MIVRGIDPGPDWIAWCDLDISSGRPVFVSMGETPAADALTLLDGVGVITIEIAVALLIGAMSSIAEAKSKAEKSLATNRVADRIVNAAASRGVRIIEVDQASARRDLGVAHHRSREMTDDQQVAVIVREMISGFPPGARATNKDKRDAALYALRGWQVLVNERATEALG